MDGSYCKGLDRNQQLLLPESVDEYIDADNPVRILDAFVEGLNVGDDLECLPPAREMDESGGRKGYSPKVHAKLLIWGYLNRVRSTRRLEKEAGRNLELIWLLGKLQPDHSSISRFRKANTKRIKNWLKAFNLICAQLQLFGAEEIAVDGTFLKAVNSKANNHTQSKVRKRLERLEEKIEAYLQELAESEKDQAEIGEYRDDLQAKLKLLEETRQQARELLAACENSPTGQISTVDKDSQLLKKKTKSEALVGYLAQSAVDSSHHLIAAAEVTQNSNDFGLLTPMAKAAVKGMNRADEFEDQGCYADSSGEQDCFLMGGRKIRVLGDGGYFQILDIVASEQAGFEPWVSPYPERKGAENFFKAEDFWYDENSDTYRCPEGKALRRHADWVKGKDRYQTYYDIAACRGCSMLEICTKGSYRKLSVHVNQASVDRMKQRIKARPEVYERRKATVEHPFGSMIFWNEGRHLLCRGLKAANAEFSLSVLAYNFKRALKVVGFAALMRLCAAFGV